MSDIYIGLSGVAGSGKDLFFTLLSQRVRCQRFSLADILKKEVSNFTQQSYGIDPITCSRQEKDLIRPLLVTHGSIKRLRSEGRHWINQLNSKILKNKVKDKIVIITDIRYDDYQKDEVYWLKEELGGYLVHISKYRVEEAVSKKNWPQKEANKVFTPPANQEETRNDPKLKRKANYLIEWEKVQKPELELSPYIDNFLKWLDSRVVGLSTYVHVERREM